MLKVKLISSTNKKVEEQWKDKHAFLNIVPNHFELGENVSSQEGTRSSEIKKITIKTANSVYEFERIDMKGSDLL